MFDNGIPFHPPGWPIALALLFRIFGWSSEAGLDPEALKRVSAVISGMSVGLAALAACLVAGRGVMMLTSLLGIFHFGHMVQAAAPNSEPLYGLLTMLVLLAAARGANGALTGALAGFAALVRVEFVLCALLLLAWLAFDQPSRPRRRRPAVLFAAGFLLVLVPTTVFNWRNVDAFNRAQAARMPGPLPTFVPITSYGAFNFANANHAGADGGFNWNLASLEPQDEQAARELEGGQLDLARPPVYRAYVDGYWMGASWLASHPVDAVRLLGRKLAIMLSVFDYGYLLDNVPVSVRGLRRPVDQLDLDFSWLSIAHLGLVLGGAWIAARQPPTRILLLPVITLLASTLLFFGYVRLGVAYLPVLWILQALAASRLLAVWPAARSWRPRAELAVAAAAAVLLLVEGARVSALRVLEIDGLADEEGRLVEDQPMRIVRVR